MGADVSCPFSPEFRSMSISSSEDETTGPKIKGSRNIGREMLSLLAEAVTSPLGHQPFEDYSEETTPPPSQEFASVSGTNSTLGQSTSLPSTGSFMSPSEASISPRRMNLYPAMFCWEGRARHVFIAGSFDNWATKIPLVSSNGTFYMILNLPEGGHYYLYCVNHEWRCCNSQEKRYYTRKQETNYMEVRSEYLIYSSLTGDRRTDAYDCLRYDQELPKKAPAQKDKPPVLPRQMTQIILNNPTTDGADLILLPLPDHVLLNHLYVMTKESTVNRGQLDGFLYDLAKLMSRQQGHEENEQQEDEEETEEQPEAKATETQRDENVEKQQQEKKAKKKNKTKKAKQLEAKAKKEQEKKARETNAKRRKAKRGKTSKEEEEVFGEIEEKDDAELAEGSEQAQNIYLRERERLQLIMKHGYYTTFRFRKVYITTVFYC